MTSIVGVFVPNRRRRIELDHAHLSAAVPLRVEERGLLLQTRLDAHVHVALHRPHHQHGTRQVPEHSLQRAGVVPVQVAQQSAVVGVALADHQLLALQQAREGQRHVPRGLGRAEEGRGDEGESVVLHRLPERGRDPLEGYV